MLRDRVEVVFRVPGQVTEIRYLDRLPEVGEVVDLRGHLWRISLVERKRSGAGYEVLCERPPTRRLRDLADELLRRVRRRSSPSPTRH